ncbi:M20 aminoacylase family protein [Pseudoroseomonas cervicalis]|uniref:Amidohydrolase n=1 Tax=Pseudoroseomonas cervicalis ATCC 49957 TaxID=525371 RepID=D5RHX7_9PROT|nr:M20 aminoacylase family protein [Pseudoroseomonas cervicalis]EFH13093.1 amidohydrolase [Pseudoroseomonas cervicalis ATCC 49957]
MPVPNRIADFAPEMMEWRRDIHTHPELGFEEVRTSAIVAEKLASWGIEVHRGIGRTGVVGVLKGAREGSGSIGLRADMDALPMTEVNEFAHRSQIPGKMHACGHDGHTAMLLGAAKYLAETRNFAGTVNFIFQPGEEGYAGAAEMIKDGLFERFPCDAVYGIHNDPTAPLGTTRAVAGVVMANSDILAIRIKGRGGHGAQPHRTVDPVLVGAQVVAGLQAIASRRTDPLDSAVVSITQFHAGSADNVIPGEAELRGTVRTLTAATRDAVEKAIEEIATLTARAHGAEAVVEYTRLYPAAVNHEEQTNRAARAIGAVVGEEKVVRAAPPVMGGEDFAFMLQQRPGAFLFVGQAGRDGKGGTPVHNAGYDFNDDLLPVGAAYFARLVEQELS